MLSGMKVGAPSGSGFSAPAVCDIRGDALLGEVLAELVRKGLRQQERVNLRLLGESMWPSVPTGSLVEVEEVAPGEARLGDVVIWQQGGQLIAHRVVQRVRDGSGLWLVTKGDNCSAADRRLDPSAVLGRVVAVYGQDGLLRVRGDWARALETAFWVSRWRLRCLAGAIGRFLPAGIGKPLVRVRDRLGHCLSLALKLTLLRY